MKQETAHPVRTERILHDFLSQTVSEQTDMVKKINIIKSKSRVLIFLLISDQLLYTSKLSYLFQPPVKTPKVAPTEDDKDFIFILVFALLREVLAEDHSEQSCKFNGNWSTPM